MSKIEELPLREFLYQLLPKEAVGVELGVQHGLNSIQLYHISRPKKMYLVDLWELKFPHLQSQRWDDWTNVVNHNFELQIQQGIVEICKQDRLDFLNQFNDNYFDWAYVDTTHTYIDTKQEAELLIKKVKAGGYIAFHDFNTAPHAWGTGVMRAVIERINSGELLATHISNEQFTTILCENIK